MDYYELHKDITQRQIPKYFTNVVTNNDTFNISNWLDDAGYPKKYEGGLLRNTIQVPTGELQQSLYISLGRNLYMGIMDSNASTGDCDVDLCYDFDRERLVIDVTNFRPEFNEEKIIDEDYNFYQIVVDFYSEEEYFQEMTVKRLPFKYEDLITMKEFFDAVRVFYINTGI